MVRIKSLRTIKWIASFSVLLLLAIAFFAFADTNTEVSGEDNNALDYVWLRYDCSAEPELVTVPGGPNFQQNENLQSIGVFSDCGGSQNICAVRFLSTEVENDPTHPGNMKPKSGITIDDKETSLCN